MALAGIAGLALGVPALSQTPQQTTPQAPPAPAPRTIVLPPVQAGTAAPGSVAAQADAPLPPGEPFAGRWDSDWGALQIDVKDGKATGMYQNKQGRIEGEVSADGRTLTGYWYQAPSYSLEKDGGTFVFTLSQDGRSFEGYLWKGKDRGEGQRDFEAVLVQPRTVPAKPTASVQSHGLAGLWESDWGILKLEVEGTKVTGTFAWNEGRIEGTISRGGQVLQGIWRKAPTYEPGLDGGALNLQMDQEGKVLRGRYWNGDEKTGRGQVLSAVRAKAPTPPPVPPEEATGMPAKTGG
jgi:hypothetical protein